MPMCEFFSLVTIYAAILPIICNARKGMGKQIAFRIMALLDRDPIEFQSPDYLIMLNKRE
jgi:hypothetical protein